MMPILSFYEQVDPDKMVQKAYFVIPETEEEIKKAAEENKAEGNQVAQKQESDKKTKLYVDFNPASITMSTAKGSEVIGTQPPEPALPSGRDPDLKKLYAARNKRYDQTVKVGMTLTFDTLSKWEDVLAGKDDANSDPEALMEGKIGNTIVGKFYKMCNGGASSMLSSVTSTIKSIAGGGIASAAKGVAGGVKDKMVGLYKDRFNKVTGKSYIDKLAECNMFSKDSTYQRLENAYLNQGVVEFIWGPMRFNGRLTNFSTEFSYFSRAGAPLRAKTTIEIELFREVDTEKKILSINSYNNNYKENAWIDQMYEKYAKKMIL